MRIHFFSALAGSAALWLLTAGCSESGTGGTGGDDRTPEEKQIDAFCDTILPPFCDASSLAATTGLPVITRSTVARRPHCAWPTGRIAGAFMTAR